MKRSPINEGNVEMDRNTPVGVRITGVGAEIPPRVVTTAELEEQADIGRFGFEPGWLETRHRGDRASVGRIFHGRLVT